MNDDFEQRLSQIGFTTPPPNLRDEILTSARGDASTQKPNTTPTPWWKEIFWPCPQAWIGMASLWAIMFSMHFGTDPAAMNMATEGRGMDPTITIVLLQGHELITDQLFERDALPPKPERKKKPAVDQPRSYRPDREFGLA